MNNPLTWKREHQIALACAIAIGLFFGFIAGLYVFEPHGYSTGDLGVASTGQNCTQYFILDIGLRSVATDTLKRTGGLPRG
jgi:hypothetical protein